MQLKVFDWAYQYELAEQAYSSIRHHRSSGAKATIMSSKHSWLMPSVTETVNQARKIISPWSSISSMPRFSSCSAATLNNTIKVLDSFKRYWICHYLMHGEASTPSLMAYSKILVDTNAYLRLVKTIRPLLFAPFGENQYCFYILPELNKELKSHRLQNTFYWVNEGEFVQTASIFRQVTFVYR